MGHDQGELRAHLHGPPAGGVVVRVPRYGRLLGHLVDGPYDQGLRSAVDALSTDAPRTCGLRESRLLSTVLEQHVHGERRQDGLDLGRAVRAVRADVLRARERREPGDLLRARGRDRVVRRGRAREALGRAHGERVPADRLRPAPGELRRHRPLRQGLGDCVWRRNREALRRRQEGLPCEFGGARGCLPGRRFRAHGEVPPEFELGLHLPYVELERSQDIVRSPLCLYYWRLYTTARIFSVEGSFSLWRSRKLPLADCLQIVTTTPSRPTGTAGWGGEPRESFQRWSPRMASTGEGASGAQQRFSQSSDPVGRF